MSALRVGTNRANVAHFLDCGHHPPFGIGISGLVPRNRRQRLESNLGARCRDSAGDDGSALIASGATARAPELEPVTGDTLPMMIFPSVSYESQCMPEASLGDTTNRPDMARYSGILR